MTDPVDEDVTSFESFARRERPAPMTLAWSLTGTLAIAEEIVQETMTAVELSFNTGSDGSEETLEIEDPGRPGTRPEASVGSSLPLGGDQEGAVAVFGTVDPAATEVLVVSPDDQPFELDIHEVDGWAVNVFVGFVPLDLAPWPDAVEVVARDTDGHVLPGWPVELGLGDF